MNRNTLYFLVTVVTLLLLVDTGHTASIRGFVVDGASREPLPVATVLVKNTDLGASTNLDGYFVINFIEQDDYTLLVSYIGYHSREIDVSVIEGSEEQLVIEILPSSVVLEEAVVTVKKDEAGEHRLKPQVSTVTVDSKIIRTMPSLGAEMDVLRAMQTIPGVKASSDLSAALHVRGGSPDQTLILMDHNVVYNPSHLFGLFSTFNADAVKHLELMKGGFPAMYGGRCGSVLEVITNDGNRNEYEGLFSIGLISARLSLEGPLPGKKGSFAGSLRRTYMDPLLNLMRKSYDIDLPDYYFYDGNGKVNLDLTDRTTLTMAGYWGNDNLDFDFGPEDTRVKAYMYWGNRTFTSRIRHALGRSSYVSAGAAVSRYRSQWGFSNEDVLLGQARERLTDYSARTDYEFLGFRNHHLRTGLMYDFYDVHFREESEDIVYVDIDTAAHNISGYIQDNWKLGSFIELQPGLRGYYHSGGEYKRVDPRLAMVYHYDPSIRFKVAGGRYTQWMNVMSASEGGSDVFDVWFPVDGSVEPTYTNQIVLGFEWDREDGYEFTTETYYTDLHNVVAFRPMVDEGEVSADAFVLGEGYSKGIEFMVQKKKGRLNGWLGYTLSWTERSFPAESYINSGDWFFPKWDRRHDFTVVTNYKLSRSWDIGVAWRYHTGQGFTQGLGVYTMRYAGFDPDDMGNDSRTILQGSKNNYRFPEDHRLDINLAYNHLFMKMPAKFTISLFNAYSRRSYWMRTFNTWENPIEVSDAKLLPVIPLISYEVRF